MIKGICFLCNTEGMLTEHHMIGVRDIIIIRPEFTIKKARNFLKSKRCSNTKIYVCRSCHNKIERRKRKRYLKEIERRKKKTKEKLVKKKEKNMTKLRERCRRRYGHLWGK